MARGAVGLVLIVLFATGYLPSRTEWCDCTAEHNCGCRCWARAASGAAAGTALPAAAPSPSSSCCAPAPATGPNGDATPAPLGHHAQRTLEFVCPDPPSAERGIVAVMARQPSNAVRADWTPPVPHGPPRMSAPQLV